MSDNPQANGGLLLKDLVMPPFRDYAVDVPRPGAIDAESTRVLGRMLRDIMRLNAESSNFRVMGPDETNSNRLDALFEVTDRTSAAEILASDDHVAPDGRVVEVLSEHMCEGWLEGYLLTGRHGLFSCYEAFIHTPGHCRDGREHGRTRRVGIRGRRGRKCLVGSSRNL